MLGGVFLIHDLGLGLAAWPGGAAEIKKGDGWGDALSTLLRKRLGRVPTAEELANPPADIEKVAIRERLRMLHAEQAERLALAPFPANPQEGEAVYYLIEDADLRQQLGSLLGKIAHSHWWSVSRLANEFGTTRGALPNCPGDWTIDPLKIAVLLRTADAAHLDARRAPGFLLVLRRPEGFSRDHWTFQNHLLKPRVEEDRLIYTTNRPFLPEEIDPWWLCEETLRMVERELHQVDALLADRGRSPRLRARGVAGVENPERLQNYIEVSGWRPIDARLHVSSVAQLARKLGGESLYGKNPTVPLRELIQNAADAVRARRLQEGRPNHWGRISVRLGFDNHGAWIEVEDTGVGMSEDVLQGPLLDFGTTYWGSDLMREEHEGLWAKGFEPTGRFGIGFFSVFMWGRRVRVTTRRYIDGPRDTRILEFRTGLDTRPFVRPPLLTEQLGDGGTRVRVWLLSDPRSRGGLLFDNQLSSLAGPLELGALCAWLAPALDVSLYVEDESGTCKPVVIANDWRTMDELDLISRMNLRSYEVRAHDSRPFLRAILDSEGRVLGRAAIFDSTSGIKKAGSSYGRWT